MKSNELLLDAFGRIRETVEATLEGLDDETLARRPAGNGNSIAWLIWHLSRVEDAQVGSAAGLEQVWTSQGFAGRFGLPLPERDTGYGHSTGPGRRRAGPAGAVRRLPRGGPPPDRGGSGRLGDGDLDRVVDTRWDPPVTFGVRLVSTIADCLQHVGQAAYAKGLKGGGQA